MKHIKLFEHFTSEATMDKIKKEESVMLPRYEEFVNEKKKSKPKSDNQKIKDLTKKTKIII